jgi:hypothetical protein
MSQRLMALTALAGSGLVMSAPSAMLEGGRCDFKISDCRRSGSNGAFALIAARCLCDT